MSAAVLRTLRAGWAPGTDRARGSCSSALPPPPPLLRLRPKGFTPFASAAWRSSLRLQAVLQVREPEVSVRVSQAAGSWGSFSRHPADSGGCSCSSALPRHWESRRCCSSASPRAGVLSPPHRGSLTFTFREEYHHSTAPGAGPTARPAEP